MQSVSKHKAYEAQRDKKKLTADVIDDAQVGPAFFSGPIVPGHVVARRAVLVRVKVKN